LFLRLSYAMDEAFIQSLLVFCLCF